MKRNVSVTCSNHERSCTMTARACIHTHTHIYTLESRVYPSTHGRTTLLERYFCKVLLARLTRTCMREITGWLTATLSCRFDYILFPLSLSRFLPSFLPPFSHTLVTRVTYPRLVVKKLKKKKKIRTDSVEEARVSSARHWTPFRRGGRNWRCDTVCWRASH